MKNYILFLLCFPVILSAQTNEENYIKITSFKDPIQNISNVADSSKHITVTFFDGLGRPIQNIKVQQSSTGKDILTHIEYDNLGRQVKEYLPYASDNISLNYRTDALNETLSFYSNSTDPNFETTSNPFSEKLLESSPLNRMLKQAFPGNAWSLSPVGQADHSIKFTYETNTDTDAVRMYKAIAGQMSGGFYPSQLSNTGNYNAGELYKTVIKDENWTAGKNHTTEEFKDKQGMVVLKRAYNQGEPHDTYYAYDQYGNLSFVIPPLTENAITQLDALCYQYRYDQRNRLVEKKLPGKDWEFIVYDKLDRVIATGPALTPFGGLAKGWLINKYDVFGRVAYTGWYNGHQCNSDNRNDLQTRISNGTVLSESRIASNTIDNITVGYTNNALPTGSFYLLSISYYDNYAFPNAIAVPSSVESQPVLANVKGLPTGTWTRTLTNEGEFNGEQSYIYYDKKGRMIKSYTTNSDGGQTDIITKLDFSGKVIFKTTYHEKDGNDGGIQIREDFTYTDQDRLLTHTHKINSDAPQLMSENSYHNLGKLRRKKVGNTTSSPLQLVDYDYNIRGWLTTINAPDGIRPSPTTPGDLFTFKINYNTVENESGYQGTPQFNGNISETYWRSESDGVMRKYSYQYDALNRLTEGIYQKPDGIGMTQSYSEYMFYDKNGNIQGLGRNGDLDHDIDYIQIDNLVYSYHPTEKNKLMRVKDHTNHPGGFKDGTNTDDDFDYDSFGNMTSDKNKGINGITYNHLNLPVTISFGSGARIDYIYDANGKKLSKKVQSAGTTTLTEYQSEFQYTNGVLDFIQTAEGYAKRTLLLTTPVFYYVFNYKDHLGNVRLSYTGSSRGRKIMEENHYYPFGLKHEKYNSDSYEFVQEVGTDGYYTGIELMGPNARNSYQYKYNGKEFQDELGLNLYDYGARNYDPAIGRWMNIDPLAGTSKRFSPYVYALDNPVFFIDPDGMEATYNWNTGKYMDGGKEVSFANAMASYGLNIDGSEQDNETAKAARDKYVSMIAKSREEGYNVAANNLQRWLNGTGGTSKIDSKWLKSFGVVKSAEEKNIARFEKQLVKLAKGLKDGETINFTDEWDAAFTANGFTELYYASGTSQLTSVGNFKVSRKGDNIQIFGSITHTWNDTYDWHPGLSASVPGFGRVSDTDALLVEQEYGDKPFHMTSSWSDKINSSSTLRFFGNYLSIDLK